MPSLLRTLPGYGEKGAYYFGLKPAGGLCLPDFLGIGAAKSGTTWLHRIFYHHPDLFVPVKKPVWYFDRHFDHPLSEYSRIFSRALPGQLKGELTATYSTMPRWKIAFIRRMMPRLKILLILRNPRDRAWSDARMELTVIQRRNPASLTEKDFLDQLHTAECLRRGDYETILKNWLCFFPRNQIWVGLFEEMTRSPERVLGEIFSFLGAAIPSDWTGFPLREPVFKGTSLQKPEAVRRLLEQRYPQKNYASLGRYLGRNPEEVWGRGHDA